MNKRCFTLLELLVVVVVISVLIALVIPAVSKVRERSRISACSSNLKQIGVQIHNYCIDYDSFLPPCSGIAATPDDPTGIQNMIPIGKNKVYLCPGDTGSKFDGTNFFGKHGSSYEWNVWFSGMFVDKTDHLLPVDVPMMLDANKFHLQSKHNFLYADGRVVTE